VSPLTDREQREHRAFLNRYYGATRWLYDATRRPYLLGRDRALELLLGEPWELLVEVGPGTGRNLRLLHASRPEARYGGLEACDAMLEHGQQRCPWATFVRGFAEDANYASVLGRRPDRILFSYSLSMMRDPKAALDAALAAVVPGGAVVVVDFSNFASMPAPVRDGLWRWLEAFHVRPLGDALVRRRRARVEYGPGRYYVVARIPG
jgi:S-adenosylmethionine-diacylgycerolhomoserine-N-methlytransferase